MAPSQPKAKNHPIVRQDEDSTSTTDSGEIVFDDESEAPSGPDLVTIINLAVKYTEYGSVFLWEVQAATVGQISGNLSVCQNNTVTVYNNSRAVYSLYQTQEYDQAGNSTYRILYSVDQIYTACYYMFFEYFVAL